MRASPPRTQVPRAGRPGRAVRTHPYAPVQGIVRATGPAPSAIARRSRKLKDSNELMPTGGVPSPPRRAWQPAPSASLSHDEGARGRRPSPSPKGLEGVRRGAHAPRPQGVTEAAHDGAHGRCRRLPVHVRIAVRSCGPSAGIGTWIERRVRARTAARCTIARRVRAPRPPNLRLGPLVLGFTSDPDRSVNTRITTLRRVASPFAPQNPRSAGCAGRGNQ